MKNVQLQQKDIENANNQRERRDENTIFGGN